MQHAKGQDDSDYETSPPHSRRSYSSSGLSTLFFKPEPDYDAPPAGPSSSASTPRAVKRPSSSSSRPPLSPPPSIPLPLPPPPNAITNPVLLPISSPTCQSTVTPSPPSSPSTSPLLSPYDCHSSPRARNLKTRVQDRHERVETWLIEQRKLISSVDLEQLEIDDILNMFPPPVPPKDVPRASTSTSQEDTEYAPDLPSKQSSGPSVGGQAPSPSHGQLVAAKASSASLRSEEGFVVVDEQEFQHEEWPSSYYASLEMEWQNQSLSGKRNGTAKSKTRQRPLSVSRLSQQITMKMHLTRVRVMSGLSSSTAISEERSVMGVGALPHTPDTARRNSFRRSPIPDQFLPPSPISTVSNVIPTVPEDINERTTRPMTPPQMLTSASLHGRQNSADSGTSSIGTFRIPESPLAKYTKARAPRLRLSTSTNETIAMPSLASMTMTPTVPPPPPPPPPPGSLLRYSLMPSRPSTSTEASTTTITGSTYVGSTTATSVTIPTPIATASMGLPMASGSNEQLSAMQTPSPSSTRTSAKKDKRFSFGLTMSRGPDSKEKDRTSSEPKSSSVAGAFETMRHWNALLTSPMRSGNSKTDKMRTWSPSSPHRMMDLNMSDTDMSALLPAPPPSAWRDVGDSVRASGPSGDGKGKEQSLEKVKEWRGAEKEKGRRKYATLSGRTSRILQDITGLNLEPSKERTASAVPELPREIGMPMSLRGGKGIVGGKKRKLVVRGVSRTDVRAVEGVRKWCETFGEVRKIVRAADGDLHIEFRSADVADNVCRLQARVYITGVGSVGLSWYTGRRPIPA